MQTTPKSLRLHIALMGRANVGKSTLLNQLAGQDVAIVSPHPGTTTDVVEKPMEWLPLGPVVLLDTAGLDDPTALGEARIARTLRVFDRADVILLLCEAETFGPAEESVLEAAARRKLPVVAVVTKVDLRPPGTAFLEGLRQRGLARVVCVNACDAGDRERMRVALREAVLSVCPEAFLRTPPLVGDLVPPGGCVVLVVPIDLQAPKGRLILPQVQAIRDILDHDGAFPRDPVRVARRSLDRGPARAAR